MAAKKGAKVQKTEKVTKKKAAVPVEKKAAPSPYSIARIKEFMAEVKSEYTKIAWPDKKVVMGSTGVVIVLVMLISMYLGAVDLLVGKIITSILG